MSSSAGEKKTTDQVRGIDVTALEAVAGGYDPFADFSGFGGDERGYDGYGADALGLASHFQSRGYTTLGWDDGSRLFYDQNDPGFYEPLDSRHASFVTYSTGNDGSSTLGFFGNGYQALTARLDGSSVITMPAERYERVQQAGLADTPFGIFMQGMNFRW